MSFTVPIFLLAALAGIVPVVLHMIHRQKAKDLPFSTLRFLRVSAQKTRRRKRIQDSLLMLIRVAVLLLIALGLAKPTLTNLRSLLGANSNSAVAIVLDNSASMGMIDSDHMRFETALHAANQIMGELRDGDRVVLLVTCGKLLPEVGQLNAARDKVAQALAFYQAPTYERADVARVQEARALLAQSDLPNKEIFVISDCQENTWQNFKKQAADKPAQQGPRPKQEQDKLDIPVIMVDTNRAPRPNVAVTAVRLEAAVPVAGVPMRVSAELFNASPKPQDRLVELYLDGNREATSPAISIPGGQRSKFAFTFTAKSGGLHRGEVRLVETKEDGSRYDDRRFFAVDVDQGIPVAIVKPQAHEIPYLEETFYLERALSPTSAGAWAIRATPLTAAQLAGEPLANYKVVFCANLPAPDENAGEKLRTYVQNGGNLFWFCGENVQPEAYNRMNQLAGGDLLPAPLLDVRAPAQGDAREAWSIASLDKEYPALSQLIDPPSLYQKVLVYKHVRMDASKPGAAATVLARLDDGEPLLVQRKVGQGSVTMLGTSAHVNWTNLPLRPIFVPLLARMVFHLSGVERVRREGVAGIPIELDFGNEMRPAEVEITLPSGEIVRKSNVNEQGEKKAVFRYDDTHEIGVYTLRPLQSVSARPLGYAVNFDPDEAEPAKIERPELERLFSGTPLVFAENPEDLSSTFDLLRQGKGLGGTFLMIVLLVLVFETFVSNRLTPKRPEDSTDEKLPPGMRRLGRKGRTAAA